MSKLRVRNRRDRSSAWERVWESLAGSPRRKPLGRKPRRLTLDQLEERTLLSVSPVNVTDQLINQSVLTNPPATAPTSVGTLAMPQSPMLAGKSVATDSNGDFVVVWCSTDPVLDATASR